MSDQTVKKVKTFRRFHYSDQTAYIDPPPDEVPVTHRHKDKKNWCRGREGIHHKGKWQDYPAKWGSYGKSPWPAKKEVLACAGCEKHLAYRVRCLKCGAKLMDEWRHRIEVNEHPCFAPIYNDRGWVW